jgi:hypothetical protein
MSEQASYDTYISIPSLAEHKSLDGNLIDVEPRAALLLRALTLAAEDHAGRITDRIVDCDGRSLECLTGLVTKEIPRGVGVRIQADGRVVFVYDAQGDTLGWGKRIAGEIAANYNTLAVRLALQAMNLEVGVEEHRNSRGERVIRVEGRS